MVFGFGKSPSHQPWTAGSYPGSPILFTSVPTYPVTNLYPSLSPQVAIAIPASPMVMPMPVTQPIQTVPVPVAVQSPMAFPTTIVQSVPSVPSPVVYAPIVPNSPRNPSPRPPRTPPQREDGGAANMMLVQPPPTPATNSSLTIILNLPPLPQPTSLRDYPPDVPYDNHRVTSMGTYAAIPAAISHTFQH
jgi:hypothetical protein